MGAFKRQKTKLLDALAGRVEKIWGTAGMRVVTRRTIVAKLSKLHDRWVGLKKKVKTRTSHLQCKAYSSSARIGAVALLRFMMRAGHPQYTPLLRRFPPVDSVGCGGMGSGDLRQRIIDACREVTPELLRRVHQSTEARLQHCINNLGHTFEHLEYE